MSAPQYRMVDVTTDGAGAATAYLGNVNGPIQMVQYIADGTSPYDNTVDFTITTEATLQNVWTESNIAAAKTVYPRAQVHSNAGVLSEYAATFAVRDKIVAVNERIKIVLAQGGASKTGRFVAVVGGS